MAANGEGDQPDSDREATATNGTVESGGLAKLFQSGSTAIETLRSGALWPVP